MWPSVGRPHKRLIRDVLRFENGRMRGVGVDLGRIHGCCAISTSMDGVRACDSYVQGRQPVVQSACENVSWAKPSARDQTSSLKFGAWVAGLGNLHDLAGNCVVTASGLGKAATLRVGAADVKQFRATKVAGDGLCRTSCS